MINFRFTAILLIFVIGIGSIQGQSSKAKKLYQYYESNDGGNIKTISKDLLNIGLSFVKTDESVKKIVSELNTIKILTIQGEQDIVSLQKRVPGKKMSFRVEGMNQPLDVWVKRCFFRVKEAHLLYETRRKTMVVSAYGNFKIKDLKELNENFIQKDGLKNIPLFR